MAHQYAHQYAAHQCADRAFNVTITAQLASCLNDSGPSLNTSQGSSEEPAWLRGGHTLLSFKLLVIVHGVTYSGCSAGTTRWQCLKPQRVQTRCEALVSKPDPLFQCCAKAEKFLLFSKFSPRYADIIPPVFAA